MFTVGAKYSFELQDASGDDGRPTITTYLGRVVLEVEGPCVKISDGPRGHMIVNTTSPVFFRASLAG